MLKGKILRYAIGCQEAKMHPNEFIMMECLYCGVKFYVGMNLLHWINQGYRTHCGGDSCRGEHQARQRAKWQERRESKKKIKSPRQQLIMKRRDQYEAKIFENRRLEDERIKQQSKNWYFGPGDIFHDVIVKSILFYRENKEE